MICSTFNSIAALLALALVVYTDPAFAQSQSPPTSPAGAASANQLAPTPAPVDLRPLDQTVEDFGPLSASLRSSHVDLRLPLGFQNVYHVPGSQDLLMRASGGVYAVFPRSAYSRDRRTGGLVPVIPAGTVFHIGLPQTSPFPASPSADVPQTVEGQVNSRIDTRVTASEKASDSRSASSEQVSSTWTMAGPAIVADQGYRRQRIDALLRRAAEVAGGDGDGENGLGGG